MKALTEHSFDPTPSCRPLLRGHCRHSRNNRCAWTQGRRRSSDPVYTSSAPSCRISSSTAGSAAMLASCSGSSTSPLACLSLAIWIFCSFFLRFLHRHHLDHIMIRRLRTGVCMSKFAPVWRESHVRPTWPFLGPISPSLDGLVSALPCGQDEAPFLRPPPSGHWRWARLWRYETVQDDADVMLPRTTGPPGRPGHHCA